MGSGFILNQTNDCVPTCPAGFKRSSGSRCMRCYSSPENNYCNGTCRDKHIRSIGDFASLKHCSRVHTLNIYNVDKVESRENIFDEAFAAFADLEQIDHELTIHNVKIFSSLAVFPKLTRIGISSNASVNLEENDFLTELWPTTKRPVIQGSLNIVRNARLCLKRIVELIDFSTSHEKGTLDSHAPVSVAHHSACPFRPASDVEHSK